jgi:hypothetical protein
MDDKLHILILEDMAADAELMEDELKQAGFKLLPDEFPASLHISKNWKNFHRI